MAFHKTSEIVKTKHLLYDTTKPTFNIRLNDIFKFWVHDRGRELSNISQFIKSRPQKHENTEKYFENRCHKLQPFFVFPTINFQ